MRAASSRRTPLDPLVPLAGLLALAMGTRALGAQESGAVEGLVTDTTGAPLAGVEVLAAGRSRARTDERGAFLLGEVPAGDALLIARRLGFAAESLHVRVAPGAHASASFRLRTLTPVLSMVVVRAKRQRSGRLADYYDRLESGTGSGGGYIITRDRIEAGNPRSLSDVLRRAPSVDVIRGRVRMRGRGCAPLVWLDGSPMPAGEVDINSFPPSSIEGIELYPSATAVPFRYQATRDEGRCGTILLWSRGPELPGATETPMATGELDREHADSDLFVASEVELGAHLAPGGRLDVPYPPELYAQGLAGVVIAEFVVDREGRWEPATFAVVSSSHPLLARAVREGVAAARFVPAMRGGRAVRQLMQLRFTFQR